MDDMTMGPASMTLAGATLAQAKDAAAVESPTQSVYVVEAGDTLASIAMKVSGSESNWVVIARANDLMDVGKSQPLEAGKHLKIPAELVQS